MEEKRSEEKIKGEEKKREEKSREGQTNRTSNEPITLHFLLIYRKCVSYMVIGQGIVLSQHDSSSVSLFKDIQNLLYFIRLFVLSYMVINYALQLYITTQSNLSVTESP